MGDSPNWVKSRRRRKKKRKILQGLRVAQAAVTEKTLENQFFFVKKLKLSKKIFFLHISSKYWGKQIFSLGSFPEVGQKQKTEKRERAKVKITIVSTSGLNQKLLGHAICGTSNANILLALFSILHPPN